MPTPLMTPDVDIDVAATSDAEQPWLVLLGNDPVNTMAYVARALKKVFGYSDEKASTLMLEAHQNGRAAVWSGERERAEAYAAALHGYSLWATVAQDA